jgi:hypothetical protein
MRWDDKFKQLYQIWLPWIAVAALLIWAVGVLRFRLQPPVGSQVAVLAVLVAIITIWPVDGRWQKAAWALVFLSLTALEISSLNRDSRELAETRAKQMVAFSNLLDQEKEIVGQVTGGDGFAYLMILSPPVDSNGASLAAYVHGNHAIRQVMYDLIEGPPPYLATSQEMNDILSGRHLNISIGDLPANLFRTINRVLRPPLDKDGFYTIHIFALNGSVTETLETRYERQPYPWWNEKITVKNRDNIVYSENWQPPRAHN